MYTFSLIRSFVCLFGQLSCLAYIVCAKGMKITSSILFLAFQMLFRQWEILFIYFILRNIHTDAPFYVSIFIVLFAHTLHLLLFCQRFQWVCVFVFSIKSFSTRLLYLFFFSAFFNRWKCCEIDERKKWAHLFILFFCFSWIVKKTVIRLYV